MLVKSYVRPLRKAADHFDEYETSYSLGRLNPLSETLEFTAKGEPKVVVESSQVRVMFLEIESLMAINTMFLDQLETRHKAWGPDTMIADVFLSMMRWAHLAFFPAMFCTVFFLRGVR